MLHIKSVRTAILPLVVFGLIAIRPSSADAQPRHAIHGPAVHSAVYVGFGAYGYPGYPYYSPWFQSGYPYPWGPWGPFPPLGYGYGFPDQLTSSIRLDVTPRAAEVFVDGYSAGRVDSYDGVFQRLRLPPGAHEITLYLAGYRTIRQSLYLSAGSDQKIRFVMEQLPAGQTSEPPPAPSETYEGVGNEPPAPRFPFEPTPPEPAPSRPGAPESGRFGTLSVRVQPNDAEILIDGERWSGPSDQERISIQLPEGRHHVEIRKAGFSQYTEDVLIRRDHGLTLNVSLLRGDADPR